MKSRPRFPLFARVLCWLVLHLVLLGLAFFIFIHWQLGLGLDSLLSGAAGDRLGAFGDAALTLLVERPPGEWNEAIEPLAEAKDVTAAIFDPAAPDTYPTDVPPNVTERARSAMPPPRASGGPRNRLRGGWSARPPGAQDPGPGSPPGPPFDEPDPFPPGRGYGYGGGPPRQGDIQPEDGGAPDPLPESRPLFLVRGDGGEGYWAGVMLHLPPLRGVPDRSHLLLIRADRLDGSGMFFDLKPWLWGGIGVLLISVAFWTPFVWQITHYLRRLTGAADQIASGRFQVSLPPRGNDELGSLGRAIESMAARLDHLISGQKRFLGDAAHELCAPLARIRTAVGILETKLSDSNPNLLSSLEADSAELAALVDEILAFSRAGNRPPVLRDVELEPLIREVLARESAAVTSEVAVSPGLTLTTDPTLLGRALANLVRNAAVHAGPHPKVEIEAAEAADWVSISVTDNGPGVPQAEIPRLFEPFYRLDRSRSRDTGGSGLGLAIVRAAVEACGGETAASLPAGGGFRVTIRLPRGGSEGRPR
jgi:two-component system sensor histidine kinase CpxA